MKKEATNYINPILMDIISVGEDEQLENVQCTLSFDELLIKMVYHNEYDAIVELISKKEFNPGLLDDIGLFDKPFPLYYITKCHQIIMAGNFIEKIMPFILNQREKIEKIMDLWRNRFQIDTNKDIEFKNYEDAFYCDADDATFYDVFLDPKERFIENGCREIDLELFEAVNKFNYDEVRRLLKEGANPDANLLPKDAKYPDDPCNCLDRIGGECSYLFSCEVFPILGEKHGLWYLNYSLTSKDIGVLIGLAAHEKMYELLIKE